MKTFGLLLIPTYGHTTVSIDRLLEEENNRSLTFVVQKVHSFKMLKTFNFDSSLNHNRGQPLKQINTLHFVTQINVFLTLNSPTCPSNVDLSRKSRYSSSVLPASVSRGGREIVRAVTFYSDVPSSNPAEVFELHYCFMKTVWLG